MVSASILILVGLVAAANAGLLPLPSLTLMPSCGGNANWTNEICAAACYDCACGDGFPGDTCYTACQLLYFSNAATCIVGSTVGFPEVTPFDACTAQAYTTRPLLPSTQDLCKEACECCGTDKIMDDCAQKCNSSAGGWSMERVCAALASVAGKK